MALFSKKKTTKAAESKEVAVVAPKEANALQDLSHIIKRPRITEKASMKAEGNVYAFEVSPLANKVTIAAAIREMFNVTPVKIAVMKIPKKKTFVRGRIGTKGGGKKAYIYLKKGETIEFV